MTIVSFDIRAALLVVAIMVAAVAWAQDDPVQTPEHVVGEQAYPFDTYRPAGGGKPAH